MAQVQYLPTINADTIKDFIKTNLARHLPEVPLYEDTVRPDLGAISVCGNGPSLKLTNLDLLVGRRTYAMNRIHLIYGLPNCQQWRPTDLVWVDYQTTLTQDVVMEELAQHVRAGERTYVGKELYERTFKKLQLSDDYGMPKTVTFLQRCSRHFGGDYLSPSAPKRWHLDDPEVPTCAFASGFFVAMQLAVMNGAKKLYLLGVDLGYVPIGEDGRDPNHFDESYVQLYPHRGVTGKTVMPAGYSDFTNRKLLYTHRVAKRSCDELGVKVYNCTAPPADKSLAGIYPWKALEEVL